MPDPSFLDTTHLRRLAYHRIAAAPARDVTLPGRPPGIVFLGGFRSDMTGTKAVFLQDWAGARGLGFVRFDYSGHGQSSGAFEDGAIGDWADDALDVLEALTDGPQILVGSSMGGWIALLLARARPDRVHALVGIAAAPDFTEDAMWAQFDAEQRRALTEAGAVELPSEYADEPYVITRRLIEEGRDRLVLRTPLPLPMPVRLLHGTADADVEVAVPLRLLAHADAADMRLTLVKGADHRFSSAEALALLGQTIENLLLD
ncbi:MAG: alpha/beta hydrolase [Pseudomonadota bacterium]